MEGKICMCGCHQDCNNLIHIVPCCDFCGQKYINSDGTLDRARYDELVRDRELKEKRRRRR